MRENLKIYRASAGSGKTFTLALEYIKLLIKNPSSYRNILAVTFTNKATAEMKERILSKLYGVANRLDDAKDYMAKIKEQLYEMGAVYASMSGSGSSFFGIFNEEQDIEKIKALFPGMFCWCKKM